MREFELPEGMTPKVQANYTVSSSGHWRIEFVFHLSLIDRLIAERTGLAAPLPGPNGLGPLSWQQALLDTVSHQGLQFQFVLRERHEPSNRVYGGETGATRVVAVWRQGRSGVWRIDPKSLYAIQ